jgi:hypothetical protein
MADDLEEIARLRDELDTELQGYEEGQRTLGPVDATDATGTVQVRLDADGVLESVRVDAAWRQRHDAGSLPGAVLEAYTAAAQARSNGWYAATAGAEPGRARPEDDSGRRLAQGVVDRMTESGRDLPPSTLLAMSELLDDLSRGVDEAFGMVDAQLSSTHRARSSSGHVGAEVSGGGEIIAIDYDDRWLENAHSFNIGRETTEAVHEALREQASRSGASVADASGLTRLQELTSDPAALSRFLGLGG